MWTAVLRRGGRGSPGVRALVGGFDGAKGSERVEQARDAPPAGAVEEVIPPAPDHSLTGRYPGPI